MARRSSLPHPHQLLQAASECCRSPSAQVRAFLHSSKMRVQQLPLVACGRHGGVPSSCALCASHCRPRGQGTALGQLTTSPRPSGAGAEEPQHCPLRTRQPRTLCTAPGHCGLPNSA